jgi:hypothetical protein
MTERTTTSNPETPVRMQGEEAQKIANAQRVEWPDAWRGAALQDGSSIGWQQAAPGNVSTCGSSMGRFITATE